ncbi:hypothetical protein NQ318_018744 [Aromia moschata]|uniref:ER-bound oxygenase mpaB/mpaB'/Rubber oxygenase catalytic domain-containing protein n=1 Tax=Aromia moschata TaxID=1265417 RepID=A0AAV8ZID9_9CUCU|nr:hypothetical protein NQ318_018744 [Aromia moschata]
MYMYNSILCTCLHILFFSEFSADEFVENLFNEGRKTNCDETSGSFKNNLVVPPFYDEELFKMGQQFFYRNIFNIFLNKFLGLMALLSVPSPIVDILILTNKSSTTVTAYKRYMETIFYMRLWYDDSFRPGTKSWESLIKVRKMHNSASKMGNLRLNHRIKQFDMTVTLFGFMGFAVARTKMMGIHHYTERELKGFIHLWRCIGYVLGIEDRFNICRESVKETKEICSLIIEKLFRPAMQNSSKHFETLSKALVSGMWAMNPFLEHEVFSLYLHMVVENSNDPTRQPAFKNLSLGAKTRLYVILYTVWSLQFSIVKTLHNYLQLFALWAMAHFPFLAYIQFGTKKGRVSI